MLLLAKNKLLNIRNSKITIGICNETIIDPMVVLDLTNYNFLSKFMVSLLLIEGISRHTTSTKRQRIEIHCIVPQTCFEFNVGSSHGKIYLAF